MSLIDKYLTIKNTIKLNNAVMEGVAKAISQKAEEEFKYYIDNGMPLDVNENVQVKDGYIEHSEVNTIEPASDVKQLEKRDFNSVMSLMKEIKSYEDNKEYQLTFSVIDSFYNSHLDDEYLQNQKTKLGITSDIDQFKSFLFWGLYFIVASSFEKSAKKDNVFIYGNKALEIYIKSQYPDFALWLDSAKNKFKDSDIFTNTQSDSLLKFFYDGLSYSDTLKPEVIIGSLIVFRDDLLKQFDDLCCSQLSENCFSHPARDKKLEQEQKDKNFAIVFLCLCGFVLLLLALVIENSKK